MAEGATHQFLPRQDRFGWPRWPPGLVTLRTTRRGCCLTINNGDNLCGPTESGNSGRAVTGVGQSEGCYG
jgi:hypothetical protein